MIPEFKKRHNYLYKPEFCDDLIKLMGRGYSNLELAAKFHIAEKTFYAWRNEHEEFEEAYQIGDPIRFLFLMEKADEYFLEGKNDKGYKHWLKKVQNMYKHYAPEIKDSAIVNNITVGNMNVLALQDKSETELMSILQNKLLRNKNKLQGLDSQVIDVQAVEIKEDVNGQE